MKIIISRTDNIGDVVLTLPLAVYLKRFFPNCFISFLARGYVKAVIESCPFIDEFILWDENLPQLKADTILHVFPRKQIAKLAQQSKILTRIGTSHRPYHWLTCNKKVNFSRAQSKRHEAQLNFELLKPLGIDIKPTLTELSEQCYLQPQSKSEKVYKLLDKNRFNLLIHPFSNGNGREWPVEHYYHLIKLIDHQKFNILITGSPQERKKLENTKLNEYSTLSKACGKLNLTEFLELICYSDGLVASGTGPLHMAAAAGTHALGLFPPAPNINPSRWAPIGKKAAYLVLNKSCDGKACNDESGCPCMQAISVQQVGNEISSWEKDF